MKLCVLAVLAMARSFPAATLLLAVSGIATASFPSPQCASFNYCRQYEYVNSTTAYKYMLCGLCQSPGNEYNYTDANNNTYVFNVGGDVSANCINPWPNAAARGTAIQFFGDLNPPPCSDPPSCRGPDGQPACCTRPCELLGELAPTFSLLDPSNPATGGVSHAYVGGATPVSDPFPCPFNPVTGALITRSFTINLLCDPDGKTNDIDIMNVSETSPCTYAMWGSTKAACGEEFSPLAVDQEL